MAGQLLRSDPIGFAVDPIEHRAGKGTRGQHRVHHRIEVAQAVGVGLGDFAAGAARRGQRDRGAVEGVEDAQGRRRRHDLELIAGHGSAADAHRHAVDVDRPAGDVGRSRHRRSDAVLEHRIGRRGGAAAELQGVVGTGQQRRVGDLAVVDLRGRHAGAGARLEDAVAGACRQPRCAAVDRERQGRCAVGAEGARRGHELNPARHIDEGPLVGAMAGEEVAARAVGAVGDFEQLITDQPDLLGEGLALVVGVAGIARGDHGFARLLQQVAGITHRVLGLRHRPLAGIDRALAGVGAQDAGQGVLGAGRAGRIVARLGDALAAGHPRLGFAELGGAGGERVDAEIEGVGSADAHGSPWKVRVEGGQPPVARSMVSKIVCATCSNFAAAW